MSEKKVIDIAQKQGRKVTGRKPKHGFWMLQRTLSENSLDRRSGVARMLKSVRDDLASDAGGWEALTQRERLLIDRTAAITVILSSIEGYVFNQETLLDENDDLLPVLGARYLAYNNSLRLNLLSLGLKPERPKSEPDLSAYIKSKGGSQ